MGDSGGNYLKSLMRTLLSSKDRTERRTEVSHVLNPIWI